MAQRDQVGFAIASQGITIQQALNAKPVALLVKEVGTGSIMKAITGLVLMASDYFNYPDPITEGQAASFAGTFLEYYGEDSLEDLIVCIKEAKVGKYKRVYRLDGQVIFDWFREYLLTKSEAREKILHNEKHSHNGAGEVLHDKTQEAISTVLKTIETSREQLKQEKIRLNQEAKAKQAASWNQHMEKMKQLISMADKETLQQLKQQYVSANNGTMNNNLNDYIEMIDEQIRIINQ